MSKISRIWVVVSVMTTGEEDIAMLTVCCLTNRRPRINAAPKKGDPAFTRGSYRKTWWDLLIWVIYTIQTITVQYNSILAKKYDTGTLNVYLPVLHNIHK